MRLRYGFTLIETLVVLAVVGVLSGLLLRAILEASYFAGKSKSASNIRQIAIANQLYAAEHGRYAPWSDASDSIHWHGKREGGEFVGTGGYLSPYLDGNQVRMCPVLEDYIEAEEGEPFDEGTGGYGYNATYIGGDPRMMDSTPTAGATRDSVKPWWTQGARVSYIRDPAKVVMFTSSAIVRGGGIVETSNSVPYRHLSPGGGFGEVATPTVHFRFRGLALVAWADAHVSFEPPNDESTSHNVYGDDNKPFQVGWFGPIDWNGYWNPCYEDKVPY